MAGQDPLKPKDNGKIKLPSVSPGMNKIVPTALQGGKGEKKDKPKRRKKADPALSAKAGDDMPKPDSGADPDEHTEEAKKQAEEDQKLLATIRKRMERCIQSESENRKAALEDLTFKAGDQWPADVASARSTDRRPCLTINKLPTIIHQVTNDQRQNRPAINISPVGDRGDPEVAKMYRGLIRAIERDSSADIAYDTAFDNAVTNGFGYFRVITEYESPDSFNQSILIKRIRNPFTVYMDPDHQEPDGADARFCFVTEMIPKEEFKEQYPDADPMNFQQGGIGEKYKDWITQDAVRIAEYFTIEHKTRKLVALSTGHIGWEDELAQETKDRIKSGSIEVLRERESAEPTIKWFKVSALEILERNTWMGKWIPVIKVIGDEVDVEGKVKLSGVVRFAKDAQRMYNYWRTAETELIALAPKAPWIMEEGQVEGHESQWKQANTKSYPYLLYKGTAVNGKPAPPPQRQQFAGIPAGVVNAAQNAAQDMMATTGIRFDASPHERMIDESGKAIRELRRSGDIGSFHYVDNLARSLKHLGRILIDLIPKIYDTKRVLTILREDDSEERVTIDPSANKPVSKTKTGQGKVQKIFNPKFGEYGVTVTIGPSYATKRIEAAESMMSFAKALPQSAAVIVDLIAKNQDWPGSNEMATRLAKLVAMTNPGVMSPNMEDVPPQVQALLSQMDQQIKVLAQERVKLLQALTDKQADRAQKQDEINKAFEAKILGIVAQVETKMAAVQEKAVSNFNTHIGAQLKQLGEGVTTLIHSMEEKTRTGAATGPKADASAAAE